MSVRCCAIYILSLLGLQGPINDPEFLALVVLVRKVPVSGNVRWICAGSWWGFFWPLCHALLGDLESSFSSPIFKCVVPGAVLSIRWRWKEAGGALAMKGFYPFRAGQTHKEQLVQRLWLARGSGEARSPPGREKGRGRKGDAHRESEGRCPASWQPVQPMHACVKQRVWEPRLWGL